MTDQHADGPTAGQTLSQVHPAALALFAAASVMAELAHGEDDADLALAAVWLRDASIQAGLAESRFIARLERSAAANAAARERPP